MVKWMLAEDIPDLDFFFSQGFMSSFVNDLSKACGRNYAKVLGVYHGKDLKFYFDEGDCKEFCSHALKQIIENPGYGEWVNSEIKKRSDALVEQSKKANAVLKEKNNHELWKIYEGHVKAHAHLYEVGWLPNAIDMFYPDFTDYLKNYLREKNEGKVNELFVALTTTDEETISQQERKNLLRIAIKISNDDFHKTLFTKGIEAKEIRHFITPEFRALFVEHTENYKHLSFLYHGLPATVFDYYRQVQELLTGGKDLAQELQGIELQMKSAKETKERLFRELQIDEKHRKLFNLFGNFMASKWHRRNAQILSLYNLENLLKEIADRFNYSLWQVRVMQWAEVKELLLANKLVNVSELNKRSDFFVFYAEEGKSLVFTGEEATEWEKKTESVINLNVTELKGQTACLGKVIGRVKIIIRPKDMAKFNQGDVLVAISTDPDIVPAMRKAGAIVTEQGGVTSHAAIVSRELNIPCIIGTKIATKVFKDGDLVEVDATKGVVRKL